MRLALAPGQKRLVLRVAPARPGRDVRYRFTQSWRAGTTDQTAVSAPALLTASAP